MNSPQAEPPPPPTTERHVRLYPHQFVGVLLMATLPALALFGMFGPAVRGTVGRVAIIYIIVAAGLRLMGKRAFGQLTPVDLLVLMLIPEFLQQGVIRDDMTLINAIVAVMTLLVLAFFTETLTYRFEWLGNLVNDKAVTVVSHGQLRPHAMDLERISPDEIQDAMHRAGIEHLKDVKWALLYPDGTVAVVPQRQALPASQGKEKPPI